MTFINFRLWRSQPTIVPTAANRTNSKAPLNKLRLPTTCPPKVPLFNQNTASLTIFLARRRTAQMPCLPLNPKMWATSAPCLTPMKRPTSLSKSKKTEKS